MQIGIDDVAVYLNAQHKEGVATFGIGASINIEDPVTERSRGNTYDSAVFNV